MKCRARMIDRSWVTFEHHDRGPGFWILDAAGTKVNFVSDKNGRNLISEFIGEGFYVAGNHPDYSLHVQGDRLETDRAALERSGVDTATVEYWDAEKLTPFGDYLGTGAWIGGWLALFPPTLKNEPSTRVPGSITYIDSWPTFDMVAAGSAKLHDILHNLTIIQGKVLPVNGLGDAIRTIWLAMEKAK